MAVQFDPPSVLYCQVPRLASSPVIAMASTGEPSGSVMLPSTTSDATVMPAGLVAPSRTRGIVGMAAALSTGRSLTAVMLTVVVPSAVSAPPLPWAEVLPSLKVQAIRTLAGGASLELT